MFAGLPHIQFEREIKDGERMLLLWRTEMEAEGDSHMRMTLISLP